MIKKLLVILTVLFTVHNIQSQTPDKFGIRAGIIFTGISTSNDDKNLFYDSSAFLSHLNFTVSVYKEWFTKKKFSISTELIYSVVGDKNVLVKYLKPVPTNQGEFYEESYITNRFQYLSLHILPRYRFVVTPSGENMYVYAGPTADMLIGNYSSENFENVYELDNFKMTFGGAFGLGLELMDFLTFEFKLLHSFTGPYNIKYGDKTISRRYTSAVFYTGVSFNKFFK